MCNFAPSFEIIRAWTRAFLFWFLVVDYEFHADPLRPKVRLNLRTEEGTGRKLLEILIIVFPLSLILAEIQVERKIGDFRKDQGEHELRKTRLLIAFAFWCLVCLNGDWRLETQD